MYQISEEKRIAVYRQMPEIFKELYASDFPGDVLTTYENASPSFSVRTAVGLVGDVILGFYKTTDLPTLFAQQLGVTAEIAKKMTTDLLEFLSPVIERETAQHMPADAPVPKAAATEAPVTETVSPAEEEDTDNVKPLRTMQADMNRVHGYGAFRDEHPLDDEPVHQAAPQDDLLKR